MKKKSLFLGLAALLMAGFSACSSDEVVIDNDLPLEKDQSFFVNIAISNTDAMTRAEYNPENDPEFTPGTAEENQINSIYLIFYNSDSSRVATTQVRKNVDLSYDDTNNQFNTGNYIYKGIVQVDVKHGSTKPAYVMCFVNPITSSNFEINPNFETLTSLQQTTRPRIIDDNGNFAMSKSVYFGNQADGNSEPRNYKKIIATPLTYGTNLFDTETEAQNALNAKKGVVDIYVERYAAKVTTTIADSNTEIDLGNGYKLKFEPELWAVNAYEENTYICKSFLSDDGEQDLSYLDLIKAFGGTGYDSKVWKWNNPEFHRCYWAQSPAYYEAAYPRVADDIRDKGETTYALRYYSYNDMKENAKGTLISKARKFSETKYTAIYARENTVAGNALRNAYNDKDASPKAAVASVVIAGAYKLSTDNGTTYKEYKDNEAFYIAGNKVNGYTVYKKTEDVMDFFIRTTIPFYKDVYGQTFFNYNTGKFNSDDEEATYRKFFKVTHPTTEARDGLVIDSRYVTIQLDKNEVLNPANPRLYVYLEGDYVEVDNDNIDAVNTQMLYAAGTVQGFNGGKAYYNIPIKHLGFYREGNPNEGLSGREDTFKWTKVQSGDFGLVRNHSYSIVVDNIEGLGNGIPDPSDPIVPPTDPEEYYIGARIIVLNWAIVPEQHVTL